MKMIPRPDSAVLLVVASLTGLAVGACVYDSGQRCGPAMTFVEAADACVCDSNAVPVPGGCKACAADEVVAGGKCACPAGQTKNASNVCIAVTGLGDACDTASAPCTNAVYSYCAARTGTAGTCTKGCTGHSDCDAAYTCTTWEAHPYCRAYTGVDDTCGSPSDCTGDAMFCDSFQTHRCIVAGCDLVENDCPRGKTCTDFSMYSLPNLCVGPSS